MGQETVLMFEVTVWEMALKRQYISAPSHCDLLHYCHIKVHGWVEKHPVYCDRLSIAAKFTTLLEHSSW